MTTNLEARALAITLKMYSAQFAEQERGDAAIARHGGRAITRKLALRVEDFRRIDAYQTVIAQGSSEPVPVWIAALSGNLGQERLSEVWSFFIDSSGSGKDGWTSVGEAGAKGHDASTQPVFLGFAEGMLDWPIYRAALLEDPS